jgi:hypothetical protein
MAYAGQAAPRGTLAEPSVLGAGGGPEGDLVAEGFQLCDQAAGFSAGIQAAAEVVGAEFAVGSGGCGDVQMMRIAWATTMCCYD